MDRGVGRPTVRSPCRGVLVVLTVVGAVLGLPVIGAARPAVAQELWVEPVDAPVVDGFRPPAHIGAPGNRGWEYATEPGTTVIAAGAGVVAHAGPVAGTLVVTVAHPDGTRTTYTHLAAVDVEVGTVVAAGDPVGVSGDRLHFGVREGAEYLDPAGLFTAVPAAGGAVGVPIGLRLVPVAARPAVAPVAPVAPAAAAPRTGAIVARIPTDGSLVRPAVPWALLR